MRLLGLGTSEGSGLVGTPKVAPKGGTEGWDQGGHQEGALEAATSGRKRCHPLVPPLAARFGHFQSPLLMPPLSESKLARISISNGLGYLGRFATKKSRSALSNFD